MGTDKEGMSWIAPLGRIGRVGFSIALFVLISFAQAFMRIINSMDFRRTSIGPTLEIFAAVVVLFGLMCLFILKRLLDVGLSRLWALLTSGPVLLYVLFAVNFSKLTTAKWLILPVVLLFLAFVVLVVVLVALPSKATVDRPDRWSQSQ